MAENPNRAPILMGRAFAEVEGGLIEDLMAMGFSRDEARALNGRNLEAICYRLVIRGVQHTGPVTAEEAECIAAFLHDFVYVQNSPYLDARGQIKNWGLLSLAFGDEYPQFRRNGFALNDAFNTIFYHPEMYECLVEADVYDKIVMRYRNGSARARQCAEMLAARDDEHYHRALTAANAQPAARRNRVQFADDAEQVELALAPLVAAAMAEQVQQALFPEPVAVPVEVPEVPVLVVPFVYDGVLPPAEEEEEEPATFQEVAQEMATPSFTPGTPFTMAMSSLGQDFLTQENSLPAFPADEDEEEDEPAQKRVRSEAEEELAPTQVVEEEEEPEEELPPTQPGRQCPNCEEKASVDHWHTCRSKVGYTCSKCSHVVTRLHQLPLVEIPME
jgi:hypothetical protein